MSKVTRLTLLEQSKLKPEAFNELLKSLGISNRHVYEGADLEKIQQAISQPASIPETTNSQIPTTNTLSSAVNSTVSGLAGQLQQLDQHLTHQIEKPAAQAIANRVLAIPGNVAIEASNIVAESLENQPVSFVEALGAIANFRLPALRQTPQVRGLGGSSAASLPQSYS